MRRILLSIIFLTLFTVGCQNSHNSLNFDEPSDERVMKGLIYKGDEDIWFIQDENNKITSNEIQNYNLLEIQKNYNLVVQCNFRDDLKVYELKSGNRVRVWFDYIRESDPARTTIFKYEVEEK